MKIMICILAALMAGHAAAEPVGMAFNALDSNDPLYAEYQRNLCKGTLEQVRKLHSERWWMDHLDPKLGAMSPDRREAWVVDYVITTQLRDTWKERFDANCR